MTLTAYRQVILICRGSGEVVTPTFPRPVMPRRVRLLLRTVYRLVAAEQRRWRLSSAGGG